MKWPRVFSAPRTNPGRTRAGPNFRIQQTPSSLRVPQHRPHPQTLKTNGVLIYLGGLLGTDLLAVLCLTTAWYPFVGAAIFIPDGVR